MNKKNKNFLLVIFLILLFVIGALLLITIALSKKNQVFQSPSKLATHTNDTYGFSISYPKTITPETKFQKYYFLTDSWMAGTPEGSKGDPLLCIPVYRVTNEKSYPRYWNVEVRIGVTTDPIELQTFLSKSTYSDTPPKEEVINNITFYIFPIEDAGMMQFISGFSYRTIHNGIGYAIEQIKTGSNYREDNSQKDIPDSILDSYFNQSKTIINSFNFFDLQEDLIK
jgi:hypothetical protein